MNTKKVFAVVLAVAMLMSTISIPAFAQTGTLQEKINAAKDGDTIKISAGTYKENLVIPPDKALTLEGEDEETTIIEFDPATRQGYSYFSGTAYPVIYAQSNLTLKNLTVAGPTNQHHGIDGILAKADLIMDHVTVRDIRCTADGEEMCGVQYGKGVIVDGTGNVDIQNSSIVKFQKNAIDLKTTGTVNIQANKIQGAGPQAIIAQNGIVIRQGSAAVSGNTISDISYTLDGQYKNGSVAIYATGDAKVTATSNTIQNIDNAFEVDSTAGAAITASGNQIEGEVVPKPVQMNGVGYATIQAAIDAAKGGETITLPAGTYEETAVANKSVTIQGSEGTVWKAPVDLIEGNYTLLQIAANDVIVDGIAFEGTYEQGDGAVSRAIVTNAGVSGIEIKNSSFKNLRQPGYLEGTILVENNYVENTRGWVVCANHDVTLTGNSFKDNAVDIAIIPNNVNENKFTDMAQLSQDNNGATAENQVSHITAQEGSIVVDASSESAHKNSLIDAINAAQEGDTIKLGAGVYQATQNEQLRIKTKGLTIEGVGDETVIDAGTYSCSGQAAVLVVADNVTLKNLKIRYGGSNSNVAILKYTSFAADGDGAYIQLQGGRIENVTIEGTDPCGHGINLHHVNGVIVDGANIVSYGKYGISTANSTITVQNTKIAEDGWGFDIGITYSEGRPNDEHQYPAGSTVTIGGGNQFSNQKIRDEGYSSEKESTVSGLDDGWFDLDGVYMVLSDFVAEVIARAETALDTAGVTAALADVTESEIELLDAEKKAALAKEISAITQTLISASEQLEQYLAQNADQAQQIEQIYNLYEWTISNVTVSPIEATLDESLTSNAAAVRMQELTNEMGFVPEGLATAVLAGEIPELDTELSLSTGIANMLKTSVYTTEITYDVTAYIQSGDAAAEPVGDQLNGEVSIILPVPSGLNASAVEVRLPDGTSKEYSIKTATVASQQFYYIALDTSVLGTFVATIEESASGNTGDSTGGGLTPTYYVNLQQSENGSIETNVTRTKRGEEITITAKADTGYEVESIRVLDQVGNAVTVTKVNDATYTFTMPASSVAVSAVFAVAEPTPTLPPEEEDHPFTDVNEGSWFYDAVTFVYQNDVMKGMTQTSFEPDTELSRAMMVQILYNLEGQPTGAPAAFADVAADAWYADAVNWAAANGIVLGISETEFAPDRSISREEMAKIIYNYCNFASIAMPEPSSDVFADDAQISGWAKQPVYTMVAMSLLQGKTDGQFDPAGNSTRAEVATVLQRLMQQYEN